MITSALISLFASLLYLVFQFIPQVQGAPAFWTDNIVPVLGVFIGLKDFPIIGTVMQIGMLALSFMVGWQTIVWANWLYNKVRGSG